MAFIEKTTDSKIVYEGPVFKIRKHNVIAKNGPAVRDVLEHNGGAVIIGVRNDGKILLIKQFRKPLEAVIYEFPAGKIDPGEEPFATAEREIKEETGYSAESVEFLFKITPSCGYSAEWLYFYLCKGLTPGETDFDRDEDIDTFAFTIDELIDMVMKGEITDAKTVAGIFYIKEAGIV